MSKWTLFSNHGHVMLFLSRQPDARLRDVAASVGITERAVQKIVRDLQDEEMIIVTKQGRRNSYRINERLALRHALEAHCTVGQLVALVNRNHPDGTAGKAELPLSTGMEKSSHELPETIAQPGPEITGSDAPDQSVEQDLPPAEADEAISEESQKTSPESSLPDGDQGSLF